MKPNQRKLIESYLEKYLNLQFPDLKIDKKKLFVCPFKSDHNDNDDKPTCKLSNSKLMCLHPVHSSKPMDIFDVVRKSEDGMEKMKDEDVADYLIALLDIQTDDEAQNVLTTYANSNFKLIPLQPNSKNPIEGVSWLKNMSDSLVQWQEWYNAHLNLGLVLGKASGVVAIDIDSDETFEKVKHLLGMTAIQTTKRGRHYLYSYEECFDPIKHVNLRNKGYEMELRANNAYIVVAPSSVEGEKRTWNGEKIQPMPKELKEFLFSLIDKPKEESEPEESEKFEETALRGDLKGLDGRCNTFFTQMGGVLSKTMPMKHVEKSLAVFNKALESPMPHADIKRMMYQIKKYRNYDKQSLMDEVLAHLKIVEHATSRDLQSSLAYEKKDIEEVLSFLIEEGKVVKHKNTYKITNEVEWEEDFISVSKPLEWKVPYFEDYVRFSSGSMIILGAKSGHGKCFAKGTKVLMYDGSFKNVENLQKNDKLMGIDSTPRNVLDTCVGEDMMYKITSVKGDSFVVNSEHILSLKKTGTYETLNIKLCDFLKQNKTFQSKYKLYRVPVEFEEQKIPLDPYFIGLWLGDGDSRDSRICNPDKEIYDYVKNYSKTLGLDFVTYNYKDKCPSVKIVNHDGKTKKKYSIKAILNDLKLLENKHIPNIYKINSRENRLKLLAGILDTDGHLCDKNFDIIIKQKELAKDIAYLARSLGFLVVETTKNVKFNFKNGDTTRNYFRLNIIGDCSVIPTKINRKKAPKKLINKNPLLTGFKIEKLGRDKYYGFFLDGDHLHLLDNFIVNHNTHLSCNLIKKFVDQGIKPHLLCTEAESKFGIISATLGVKVGDYLFKLVRDPSCIELKDNTVTIIDWLKAPESDYARLESVYERLNEQMAKHRGLLIILAQLKTESGQFYAEDMTKFYGSLVAKYFWSPIKDAKGNIYDWDAQNTYFKTEKIRDSKNGKQFITIPTYFDPDKKTLELRK